MSQQTYEPQTAAEHLNSGFGGVVHLPGDAAYDEARRPLRQDLDPRPALVAEASGPADVRAAVLTVREHGLPFAVQATGHGTHVPADGGLLLKTSGMSSVLVDPARRIARVGPGARWADVLAAAAPFGLAPASGSSPSVGVTGYTLGGGVGWLSRKYGFAADNVLRAQVVTADGRIVTASPDHHPDLFWALRGGGGNFGVVTSLEFRLHPVAQVYAGIAHFAIDRAAETLARYRDWCATVPDEMSTAVVLGETLAVKVMYAGAAEEARRLLEPLWKTAGPALRDDLRPMAYAQAAMGGTPARHLDLADDLPDSMIDALVLADAPTVEIRHWGGAMASAGPGTGPVGHREAPFSVIADAPMPGLAPYATGRSFLNFLADPARTATAFTAANLRRLGEVKRVYDPGNLFSVNLNIAPR